MFNNKFLVVEVKLGYIVQNAVTYVVVGGPYKYKSEAQQVCDKLNGHNSERESA